MNNYQFITNYYHIKLHLNFYIPAFLYKNIIIHNLISGFPFRNQALLRVSPKLISKSGRLWSKHLLSSGLMPSTVLTVGTKPTRAQSLPSRVSHGGGPEIYLATSMHRKAWGALGYQGEDTGAASLPAGFLGRTSGNSATASPGSCRSCR